MVMDGKLLQEDHRLEIEYGGDFEDDKFNGDGTYTWPDGSVYKGEWKDNQSHGYGVHTQPDGSEYDGEWKDDLPHGTGVGSWANGERYDGEFECAQRHGQGTLYLGGENEGDRFVGEFRNDKMHDGVLSKEDGSEERIQPKSGFMKRFWKKS